MAAASPICTFVPVNQVNSVPKLQAVSAATSVLLAARTAATVALAVKGLVLSLSPWLALSGAFFLTRFFLEPSFSCEELVG